MERLNLGAGMIPSVKQSWLLPRKGTARECDALPDEGVEPLAASGGDEEGAGRAVGRRYGGDEEARAAEAVEACLIVIQWVKDLVLEIRIQLALNDLLSEPNRDRKREIAARMSALVERRSHRRVESMERKAGLQ